ncbi:hypothetical protein RBSH_05377 [Rhodopirellula baltica SH28]|uniref:Uncharacterized protein n=1 Tax=Rhodopirellula baltica SH28 TaxID=993517 RepID=K5D954_RHOBT|nr:hypothetical protein RBSH_05377 [Rhodopirellula baltica SH28]
MIRIGSLIKPFTNHPTSRSMSLAGEAGSSAQYTTIVTPLVVYWF